MTVLDRIRRLFSRQTVADMPEDRPDPASELHGSYTGAAPLCGWQEGMFRWTGEVKFVTCPACKAIMEMNDVRAHVLER